MRVLQIVVLSLVSNFLPPAFALEPICQILVYDRNPQKPILESKTVPIDSDPVEFSGFSFSAQSVFGTEEEKFPPLLLRMSHSGYVASSYMRGRSGNVQLSNLGGQKAVGRCLR